MKKYKRILSVDLVRGKSSGTTKQSCWRCFLNLDSSTLKHCRFSSTKRLFLVVFSSLLSKEKQNSFPQNTSVGINPTFLVIFLLQTLKNTIEGVEGEGVDSIDKYGVYQNDGCRKNVGRPETVQVICGSPKMFK